MLARDRGADGHFVYAVATTGIFCRPSCPSRQPRRDNMRFFDRPADAAAAGYRACKRCRPTEAERPDRTRDLVKRVCAFIDGRGERPPTLAEIAAHLGLSAFHVQRTFTRAMGLSPRAYADARRLGRLKQRLRRGEAVAGALYDAGYGSASRLYESAQRQLGMTPAVYRKGARNVDIAYAIVPSALGPALIAGTAAGLAYVAFDDDEGALEAALRAEYPRATLTRDDRGLGRYVRAVVAHVGGRAADLGLPLDVEATAFERRVWRALQRIPAGETRTYQEIARAVGRPKAARAVGNACARNPVSVVVPCHRAIRGDGSLGGYAWGLERKRRLLESEHAKARARRP